MESENAEEATVAKPAGDSLATAPKGSPNENPEAADIRTVIGEELENIGRRRKNAESENAGEVTVAKPGDHSVATAPRRSSSENPEAVDVRTVIANELEDICRRRGQEQGFDPKNWKTDCHQQKLFGVCISGGGIRSATYGLGVLQGLVEKGLLQKADYLSTVSGGGYIGSWLQGLLFRDKGYAPLDPARAPKAASEDPIAFLRKYSNYLAPRPGFSIDTLVIPLIWFRNILLNQTIMISAFLALFVAMLVPGPAVRYVARHGESWTRESLVIAVLLALVALVTSILNLQKVERREFADTDEPERTPCTPSRPIDYAQKARLEGQGTESIRRFVAVPLLLAALFLVMAVSPAKGCMGQSSACRLSVGGTVLFVLLGFLQWFGGFVDCYKRRRKGRSEFAPALIAHLQLLWMAATCTAFTLILVEAVTELLQSWNVATPEGCHLAVAFGPPLYLMALIAGIGLQIGLMGQDFPDGSREWLTRVAAFVVSLGAAWAGLFALAIFAPYGIAVAWLSYGTKGRAWIASAGSAWVATTAMSVLAGKSAKSGAADKNQQNRSETVDAIARYGPAIAILGFLLALGFIVQLLVHWQPWNSRDTYLQNFVRFYWDALPYAPSTWLFPLALFILLVVVFLVFSGRININEFSMHHFYKNRLVRCYLGASAANNRAPNAFTGFDPRDDIPLSCLTYREGGAEHRPYPILNCTLTVTEGSDLATQERKGLNWVFTPLYSGFVPARSDDDRKQRGESGPARYFAETCRMLGGVGLGTAFAISGAAVNPNDGVHSSPQTAFLLTLFNVRLGWWVGHPGKKTYCRPGPLIASRWLARELFGLVDESSAYLNLCDGGNFENLGLYELVRRRCHYIIAVDGEGDEDYKFESLGGAVRKCRTDFGVEIDIDPRPIMPDSGRSRVHCVVGTIRYPEPGSEPGWLLYLKASISGDEPEDVEEYRREHTEFPQQSTLNQFFTESQFESYRRLGLHIARTTLDHFDGAAGLGLSLASPAGHNWLEKEFRRLAAQWEPPPCVPPGATAQHAGLYSKLLDVLAGEPSLQEVDLSMVENIPDYSRLPAAQRRRFFFYLDLLQLVETIFIDLDLGSAYKWNHPGNAGWKHVISYWARQDGLKFVWSKQRQTYGRPFRDFFDDLVQQVPAVPEDQRH